MTNPRKLAAENVLRTVPGDFMPSEVSRRVLAAADAADDCVRVPRAALAHYPGMLRDAGYKMAAEIVEGWLHG